jgi:hypothetical protein
VGRKDWEKLLDYDPTDWVTRLAYADWLDDCGGIHYLRLANAHRWMVQYKRFPGPPCVCSWSQYTHRSWFSESNQDLLWALPKMSNHPRLGWGQYDVEAVRISADWCLPDGLFCLLGNSEASRHIDYRHRVAASHNNNARSWCSRWEAERALAYALDEYRDS